MHVCIQLVVLAQLTAAGRKCGSLCHHITTNERRSFCWKTYDDI